MSSDNVVTKIFVSCVVAVAVLGLGVMGFGTTQNQTVKAAEAAGMVNVIPGNIDLFACGEEDLPGRKFVATNPVGKQISGIVCCGAMKACTVRY